MKHLTIISALISLLLIVPATVSAQDVDDGYNPNVSGGDVLAMTRGFGGRQLIGGSFTQVGGLTRNRLALLDADDTVSALFNPNIGGGSVFDVATDQFNDFLVVGSFSTLGGSNRNRIVRLDIFGDEVGPFSNPNPNGTIYTVVPDPDSDKFYIGGSFTQLGGTPRTTIARLNYNGTVDTSFVPVEFTGSVRSIAIQPDGKVLIAGNIGRVGDIMPRRIYRLNTDGSWDNSFTVTNLVGAPHLIHSIALQDDGSILVGGDFPGYLRRYHASGALDTGYEPPTLNAAVRDIDLQPDGRAIVVGDFSGPGARSHMARLDQSGSLDNGFAQLVLPSAPIHVVAVQPDGTIAVGGAFTNFNGTIPRGRLARLTSAGVPTQTLATTAVTDGIVRAIALEASGTLLVGGQFQFINGVPRTRLARVLENGNVSGSFLPVITGGSVRAISVQPDGKILIGGSFSAVNGHPRTNLARLNPDGSLDASFQDPEISTTGGIESIVVLENGSIVIAGSFLSIGTLGQKYIARLNPNGTLDTGFQPPNFNFPVFAVLPDQAGRLYLGGPFSLADGQPRSRLARLNANGSLDTSFIAEANDAVNAMAWRGNDLLIGGLFTNVNGQERQRFATLDTDGNLVSVNVNVSNRVSSIAVRADGRIYIAGVFTQVGGLPRSGLALLDNPNSVNSSFAIQLAATGTGGVRTMAVQADGRLVIGGVFSEVDGQARWNLARLRVPGDVDQHIDWNPVTEQVTWTRGGATGLRIGPTTITAPRVLVSASCCNSASFVPPPGGGVMTPITGGWRLNGFSGMPGQFYLTIDGAAGEGHGRSRYPFRTPVYRFFGTDPGPVQADVSIRGNFLPEIASPGDLVVMTLQVDNAGPSPASSVEALITLPPGLSYSDHFTADGDFDPSTGSWKLPDLDDSGPGSGAILQIELLVNPVGPWVAGAEIEAAEFDPDINNNLAQLELQVMQDNADLSMWADASNPNAMPGDSAGFLFEVENLGPDQATGVTVVATLPTGYSYIDHSTSMGSFDPASGLWTIGDLQPFEGPPKMDLLVSVASMGDYTLAALVSADQPDPLPGNNLATVSVNPFADLAVDLGADDLNPSLNDQVVLTVTARHQGGFPIQDAEVEVPLPAGLEYVSHQHAFGSYDPATGSWKLGEMAPPAGSQVEMFELQIVAKVTASGLIGLTATIAGELVDPQPLNNSATVTLSVASGESDLSLAKTVDNGTPEVGTTVTFQIVVTNLGPDPATGVVVVDQLPSGFIYASHVAEAGTSFSPGTGQWSVGGLDVGQSRQLSLTVEVAPAGDFTNVATVSFDGIDPHPWNNTAIALVHPVPPSDVIFYDGFEPGCSVFNPACGPPQ